MPAGARAGRARLSPDQICPSMTRIQLSVTSPRRFTTSAPDADAGTARSSRRPSIDTTCTVATRRMPVTRRSDDSMNQRLKPLYDPSTAVTP